MDLNENPEVTAGDKILIEVSEDLEPLIPTFIRNRHRDVENILVALNTDDFEAIQRIGHSMKGVGSGYGFDFITEFGQLIEEAATKKQSQSVLELANKVTNCLNRVEVRYFEE